VLGIALTGLFPLMVVCSRGVESLELRYTEQGNRNSNWFSPVFRPDVTSTEPIPRENYGTWYAIPSADPWARKLGAVATFSRTKPTTSSSSTMVDDLDTTGYVPNSTASWVDTTNANAFRGHCQRHDLQSPATDTAVWTFSNVASGRYYVMATWQTATDLATDARYDVYDGGADPSPVTVLVDQTAVPNSSVYAGWKILTTRNFQSTDKLIRVKLSSNTNKAVVADGVRIVPTSTILSVDKSFNSEEVTIRVQMGASP